MRIRQHSLSIFFAVIFLLALVGQSIAGLAYRTPDGRVRLNPPRPAPPLDTYPMMALDFLEELVERYGREVRVSLVSSRGCYADCSYCSVRAYSKLARTKPYRMRSVDRIAGDHVPDRAVERVGAGDGGHGEPRQH